MLAPGARRSPVSAGRVGNVSSSQLTAPKLKIPPTTSASPSAASRPSSAGGAATAAAAAANRAGSNHLPSSSLNTARSTIGTARSTSAQSSRSQQLPLQQGGARPATGGPTKPFHRPLLSQQQNPRTGTTVRQATTSSGNTISIKPIYDAREPVKRSASSSSTGGAASAPAAAPVVVVRSSGRNLSSNDEARHGAAARIARSPSPANIPARRCKYCGSLVQDLERHIAECACAPLECGWRDSETAAVAVNNNNSNNGTVQPPGQQSQAAAATMCNFVARGAKHLAEHRAGHCPFRRVPCRNAEVGCSALVSVASMERHCADSCSFSLYVCEFCKASVTRGAHEAHVSTECPHVRVLCPLGCGRDIPRCELESHVREQWGNAQHPRGVSKNNNNGVGHKLPPESSRRVTETLLSVLDRQSQTLEAQAILAASDDLDLNPIAGSIDSLEHSLFVAQCVWRSTQRLMEWCSSANAGSGGTVSQSAKQQVFEILERRAELSKTRLNKHAAQSAAAVALKNTLDTSLGKVALKVCE